MQKRLINYILKKECLYGLHELMIDDFVDDSYFIVFVKYIEVFIKLKSYTNIRSIIKLTIICALEDSSLCERK